MNRAVLAASIAAFLTAGGIARAHDTWVLPQRFSAQPGETVTVEMTSGMEFPENDHPVAPDRLELQTLRLAKGTAPLAVARRAETHLALSAPLATAGIAGLAVSSKPREIELTPEQVVEYFDEIGASAELREEWEKLGRDKFRETYRKHATSFVRVGDPGEDRSWAEPQGLALEIVPLADPTRAAAGDFPVRVLFEGAPLAGLPLAAVCEQRPGESHATSDADGRAELTLASGRCLLKAVYLRRSEVGPTEWVSDFATLALSVQ